MHVLISMFPCTFPEVMNLIRRDSVTGTPIVPKNLICSRLRTEFEEIEFLGKGGFGDVVKVFEVAHYTLILLYYVVCINRFVIIWMEMSMLSKELSYTRRIGKCTRRSLEKFDYCQISIMRM